MKNFEDDDSKIKSKKTSKLFRVLKILYLLNASLITMFMLIAKPHFETTDREVIIMKLSLFLFFFIVFVIPGILFGSPKIRRWVPFFKKQKILFTLIGLLLVFIIGMSAYIFVDSFHSTDYKIEEIAYTDLVNAQKEAEAQAKAEAEEAEKQAQAEAEEAEAQAKAETEEAEEQAKAFEDQAEAEAKAIELKAEIEKDAVEAVQSEIIEIESSSVSLVTTDVAVSSVSTDTVLETVEKTSFEGYTLIEVYGGNLSGYREPNVVVDVGFGTREYWAFTNEYGQLERVIAAEIILQDDENEPVLSTGRYYPDEAKVPGTESPVLDEGHVIADSLGGVSNAYNITPQECTLNRYGDQAYMEKWIRDAGGCTDFEAIITYSDTETHIPSHYKYTYTLNGNVIVDEFDNVNSDEVNNELEVTSTVLETTKVEVNTETITEQSDDTSSGLEITRVSLSKEEVDITNNGSDQINLKGYVIVSVTGSQSYTFPDYILAPGSIVTVYARGGEGDLEWCGSYIWNNDGDPAELYSYDGELIDRR